MPIPMTRRAALLGPMLTAGAAILLRSGRARAAESVQARLAAIETKSGGRLGVTWLDMADGARIDHRGDERFPMCSTFKFLAAAAILARVDQARERLDRRIVFAEKDLLSHSPATKAHAGAGGMTVAELCEAAVTLSDNTAANLLLAALDGPQAVTAYARSLGDEVTRLDRIEPELNEARPGDPRDTTTPAAMAENLRKVVLGDALSPSSRERITQWLLGCKTGDARLRKGLPQAWRVGDKTGTNGSGTSNDIAVAWPPGRAPLVITAYLTHSPAPGDARDAVLADTARLLSGGS